MTRSAGNENGGLFHEGKNTRGTGTAVFIRNLNAGGAERAVVNLLEGMVARGIVPELVLCSREGVFLEQLPPQIPIVDLGCQSVYKAVLPLAGYLRRRQPATLISHASGNNGAIALAGLLAFGHTRVFLVEHGSLRVHLEGLRGWKRPALRVIRRLFYPRAAGIIAVSRGLARDLEAELRLPEASVHTIYNPVIDPALLARSAESLDHPWFLPGQPPVILGAGRLVELKDHATLIRAFALVRTRLPARLLILGEGPSRPKLEALARELELGPEVLSLPGFTPNPYAYMKRAATFVLSSRLESLPTVLIEAMACGCPVISSDCTFGPAEILEGGKYGPLYPVGDAAALAQAITRILRSPPERRALVRRAMDFSFDRAVDEYRALLI